MTLRHSETTGPSVVPRPLLRHWAEQSGALSALPDAPVVAEPPRRGTQTLEWLARQLPRRHPAVSGPSCVAATHQPANG